MIRQLAHACFYSRQPAALLRFYREGLGLELAFVMRDRQGEDFGWYIACGNGTFIEFFDEEKAIRQWGGDPAEARPSRWRHVCFEVMDLPGFRAELIARGLVVGEITEGSDHSLQAWISDPDGNPIELMQYTRASRQFRG